MFNTLAYVVRLRRGDPRASRRSLSHQHHIARLDGHIGADRDPDIHDQRRRVVYAVANGS
jgi:hypothetical protein